MDLRINEDQSMMKKGGADFLKAEAPSYVITDWFQKKVAFLPELYKKTAEVGWLGMMLPEEYGGAGASCTDCAVVFEELGGGPLPGPYFSSGVLAAEIILAGGSQAQKKTLLPEICRGRAIVIPAISDDPIQWGPRSVQTRLSKTAAGFKLTGTKRFVYDGEAATSFICAARAESGGVGLALVDRNAPGVSVKPILGFMIGAAEVRFDNVAVTADDFIGDWVIVERALRKALPILCAFKVGACQEIFEMTNEYTH